MMSIHTHYSRKQNPIAKWLINRKLRKLKLDDVQKEKLDALFDVTSSAYKDHKIEKNEVQEQMTTMLAAEGFDRDRTAELIRASADRHADHATEIAGAFGDLYEALDPSQQEQVLAMLQKRVHSCSHRCH